MQTKPGKQYLNQLQQRYRGATKQQKQTILDEFTETTGYHRKHAIAVLRGRYRYGTRPIRRPHRSKYTPADAVVLAKVADLLDWICSKRLKPAIPVALDHLRQAGKVHISDTDRRRLVGISPASIDRLFTKHRKRPQGKGQSYTKPGTLLKTQIPIRTFADWSEDKVGFEEIDLVGHDGGVAKGDFAFTLHFTDIKSCWGAQVAVVNKAQVHVFAAIKQVRSRLPFVILGIDCDAGSEFINHQLYRYCLEEKITFTRGRPGKKNDAAHIEQKNDSIVRQWVGYGRYDTPAQVTLLNELYAVLRLYLNFFVPVQKLTEKVRIGSKVIKRYDQAKTPYHRILAATDVSDEVKAKLTVTYQTLNLVTLKEQTDAIVRRLKPTPVR